MVKVTLAQFDTTLEYPVVAGAQRHDQRTSLFLRLESEGVEGVGEISPQPQRLNGDPGLAEVVRELRDVVVPQLRRIYDREGRLPRPSRITSLRAPRSENAAALALVEMALLDRELRADSRTISDVWTPTYDVRYQSAISLITDDPWTDLRGVHRVRAKVAPGKLNKAALERLSLLEAPIILDFNASARSIIDVLDVLEVVRRCAHVVAVEQPFNVGDLATTSELARTLDVKISLDESVRSVRDVRHIVHYRCADLICVKPARVGGLAAARSVISLAHSLGLRAYVGGFFETPYARFVHRILAGASTPEPSDVANVPRGRAAFAMRETPFGFGLHPGDEVFHDRIDLSVR